MQFDFNHHELAAFGLLHYREKLIKVGLNIILRMAASTDYGKIILVVFNLIIILGVLINLSHIQPPRFESQPSILDYLDYYFHSVWFAAFAIVTLLILLISFIRGWIKIRLAEDTEE